MKLWVLKSKVKNFKKFNDLGAIAPFFIYGNSVNISTLTAITDINGIYNFGDVEGGVYNLSITAPNYLNPGYSPDTENVVFELNSDKNID